MNRSEIIVRLRARNIAFNETATDAELFALLNHGPVVAKQLPYAGGKINIVFNNDAKEEPAEILIYEEIGRDPWTGDGVTAKDIRAALNEVPRGHDLDIRINSRGGDVAEGLAIRSVFMDWPGRKIATNDGVAASTASWCVPADEYRARKASQFFLHKSWGVCVGNSDDMRQAITFLETTDEQIAEIYSDATGKSKEEMMALMKAETLLTGQQAKDLGLVDTLIDGDAVHNFSATEFSAMKQKLAALNSLRNSARKQGDNQQQEENTVNRQQKITLLNQRGIQVDANATDAQIDNMIANSDAMRAQNAVILNKWNVAIPQNATDAQILALIEAGKPTASNAAPNIIDLQQQIADQNAKLATLTSANSEANRLRVTNEIEQLIKDDKLQANLKTEAITDCIANPARLDNFYKKLQPHPVGAEPLNATPNLEVTAAISDIAVGFEQHNEITKAWQRGNDVKMDLIRNSAVAKANFFRKFENRLIQVMNTNTIPAGLKRQVILQDIIRDFVRRLAPLSMFSTVFQNVPLQGLNTVEVPFYDLDTGASTSFVSGTGYTTIGDTATDVREITIGEGATNGDRLYQALSVSSQELVRQPYLNNRQLAQLKAEKLASDIFTDILSIVTALNYGGAAKTSVADLFDSDDIADMKLACKLWPELGRLLMLDSAYDANLLKDPAFKHALNAASDSAIKEGRLFPRVMGFDYKEIPTIPGNGQNLVGFAAFKSAILVATAPVPPVEEVRNSGTTWEMVTDPQTGISFEFRAFGNNVTDAATNVIECSYGFAKGNGNALKRIVSA